MFELGLKELIAPTDYTFSAFPFQSIPETGEMLTKIWNMVQTHQTHELFFN